MSVALQIRPVSGVMEVEGICVEVRRNPDSTQPGADGADFIRWPFQVEFDAAENGGPAEMVGAVESALDALWGNGVDAVAAADFEHELRWSGGIQRPLAQ